MSLFKKFKETFSNLFSKPQAGVISTPVEDDDLTVVSPSMTYAKPDEAPVVDPVQAVIKPTRKPRKPRAPKAKTSK